MLEKSGAPEVYFADYQNTLEALTSNILGALNRCVGFIGVMHHRGKVATPERDLVRASVWIEQEIAIAAFIQQILDRKIEVQLYIQEGIAREGMRDKLLLNASTFKEDREVLEHLREHLLRWTALAAKADHPSRGFEEAFPHKLKSTKENFWLRKPRRDGVQGLVRSSTHLWICLFPVKPAPIDLDLNVSRDFVRMISANFATDRQLASEQSTPIGSEVTFDKAREFVLPITPHNAERRWRLGPGGEIGFVAQSIWPINDGTLAQWSAYDVALDALSLLRLASSFMVAHGYEGWVRLYAELNVHQAQLATERSTFPALFHQQLGAQRDHVALDLGVIIGSGAGRAYASFQTDFAIKFLASQLHDIVARMLSQLAIGLGYEVDLSKLQTSLRIIFS